jgi:catechol 2,3-dioxygenase-like lactoylglutathione lyase family enzyme
MRATALNHVSVPALDLEESVRFYEDVLGVEEIPAPNFGFPVRWFRLGDLQLHLFQVSEPPSHTNQHFGIEVDDFEEAFRRFDALGLFEDETFFAWLRELEDGTVQMYVRDPSDNLIEIDHPDASSLDRAVFGERLRRLDADFPQSEENKRATLFLSRQEA